MLVVQYHLDMRETLDIEVMFSIPRDLLIDEAKEAGDAFVAGEFVKYLTEELGTHNPYMLINLHRVSTGTILEGE